MESIEVPNKLFMQHTYTKPKREKRNEREFKESIIFRYANLKKKYCSFGRQAFYMTVLGHIKLGAHWSVTMPSFLYDRSRPYKLALSMLLKCSTTH